jgi:hypothetical protein
MEGIRAPRQIQKRCERDINYIWLLDSAAAPEFNRFERFRRNHLGKCADTLLAQLVQKLAALDEIRFEHLFVDGTKIEANANKYSFVWKKSVTKYETRLLAKLERKIPQLCEQYGIMAATEEDLLLQMEGKMVTSFVHGRGKRKSQLQRDIEELQGLLQRKEKYSGYQGTFGDHNSFSKADPDVTFMHMKEDHMRNSQLKPGYNIQFGVEGEYIVGVDVSSERNDQNALIPLLEQMEEQLGTKYQDVTADAGYESEENYSYLEEKKVGCYIKPANYERSKTKKFKSNMSLRENMNYDALMHTANLIERKLKAEIKEILIKENVDEYEIYITTTVDEVENTVYLDEIKIDIGKNFENKMGVIKSNIPEEYHKILKVGVKNE